MRAIGLNLPRERDDAELAGRVMTALAHEGQLRSDDLRVLAEGGTVTLLGTVDSPEERERAVALARTLPGVQRVIERLTVAVERYLDDRDLEQQATAELEGDPRVDVTRVSVSVEQGVATLHGRVDTLAQEEAAIAAVERVKGLRAVVSAVEVGEIEPTREPVGVADDATLRGWVSRAIADAGVAIFDDASYVLDGIAYLRGQVRSQSDRRRAVRAAGRAPGLQGVRDELIVLGDAASRDRSQRLAAAVRAAIEAHPSVSPGQVDVEVVDDVAYLRGQVDSIEDRDALIAATRRVRGIAIVDAAGLMLLGRQPLRASDREVIEAEIDLGR